MNILEIKKEAAQFSRTTRADAWLLTIIFSVPTVLFSALPFILELFFKSLNLKAIFTLPIFSIISLIYSLIVSSYFIGEKAWLSGEINNSRLGIKRLTFWFKPKYSVKAFILKTIIFILKSITTIILLCPAIFLISVIIYLAFTGGIEIVVFISITAASIILFLSGIIFAFIINQIYFLSEYLYICNPNMTVSDTIKRSKNLLDGHIFTIVKFKLSFLPLFLSWILIVPAIIFRPYYKLSCSILAKELCL